MKRPTSKVKTDKTKTVKKGSANKPVVKKNKRYS